MAMRKIVTDAKLSERASSQLLSRGLRAPCNVHVNVSGGVITLSGTVEYAHQKAAATNAVDNIDGAKRVVNQLEVKPMVR